MLDLNLLFESVINNEGFHNRKSDESFEQLVNYINPIHFIDKAQEASQFNLLSSGSDLSDMKILLRTDDPDLQCIGWSCIGGIHTFTGNYRLASLAFKRADNVESTPNVKSYFYMELANYYRKLQFMDSAFALLDKAMITTNDIKLKWRIRTIQGYVYNSIDWEKSNLILQESLLYYRSSGENIREAFVLKHLGDLQIKLGNYNNAEIYYNKALEIVNKHMPKKQFDIMNDIGWLNYKKKKYEKAFIIFNSILDNDLTNNPYIKCLVLQNLACISADNKDYRNIINYHTQSIYFSEKFGINDLIYEDYYKIAVTNEKLNDYSTAAYWYNRGYLRLMTEIREFHYIFGEYKHLLLEGCHNFFRAHQNIKYNDPLEKPFEFAINLSFDDVLKIFQTSFLRIHISKTKTSSELCSILKISNKSYYNYKIKLQLNKRIDTQDSNNKYLDAYISSLLNMTWKEVMEKFNLDLFTFLLKKFKYNKRDLAKSLKISSSNLYLKTKYL